MNYSNIHYILIPFRYYRPFQSQIHSVKEIEQESSISLGKSIIMKLTNHNFVKFVQVTKCIVMKLNSNNISKRLKSWTLKQANRIMRGLRLSFLIYKYIKDIYYIGHKKRTGNPVLILSVNYSPFFLLNINKQAPKAAVMERIALLAMILPPQPLFLAGSLGSVGVSG